MMLTKSKYLAGIQCPRYLWTLIHDKEKVPPFDKSAQFRMDEGTQVGELATKLFQGGVEVPFGNFKENLEKSKELLKKKKPLFEAGILYNDCFSRADILIPIGNKWDIIEVKSGTRVKPENVYDVAFQKYCYEGIGLEIRKCFLMHLNNEYVKKGEINLKNLFVKEEITEQVNKLKDETLTNVNYMLETLKKKEIPIASIGPRCKNPRQCPLSECWDFLPENHVFHLYRGGKKSLQLFEDGFHAILDIPEDIKLTDRQGIQRKCEKTGKVHIDKSKIKQFLESLQYPLYYLDFETFNNAVPRFDGTKPYSQIPFQYSLHVVEKEGAKPKHFEYLYDGNGDPREGFTSELVKVMGQTGSVIVYNESFEIGRLKEMAEFNPIYEKQVRNIIGRVVDLFPVFRNFHYYNPEQKGSASLKKVLPAMTGKNYDGMDIADGSCAAVEFFYSHYKKISKAQKDKVRKDLLDYCKMDTMAEVWIVEKLRKVTQ